MNEMDASAFDAWISGAFPGVTPLQREQFAALAPLYQDWNSKINVISRKDMEGLYLHHVIHSLAIARYLQENLAEDNAAWQEGSTVLDLGTGGGFPGIPLAILFPRTRFTLCDSIGKKITVVRAVASALDLKNVEAVHARAESLGLSFDYVVSRAVASLEDFYPWVKGCFRKRILYLRGGDVATETALLAKRFRLQPGTISTWAVKNWLDDPWFDGKFVVDIHAKVNKV